MEGYGLTVTGFHQRYGIPVYEDALRVQRSTTRSWSELGDRWFDPRGRIESFHFAFELDAGDARQVTSGDIEISGIVSHKVPLLELQFHITTAVADPQSEVHFDIDPVVLVPLPGPARRSGFKRDQVREFALQTGGCAAG